MYIYIYVHIYIYVYIHICIYIYESYIAGENDYKVNDFGTRQVAAYDFETDTVIKLLLVTTTTTGSKKDYYCDC